MKKTLFALLFAAAAFGGAPATIFAAPVTTLSVAPRLDTVDDLIDQGRAKLSAGEFQAAKELFDRAAKKDKSSLRTTVWQLRVAMQIEPMNDVLGRIDTLARDNQGAPINYLYGMAFAVKAQQALDAGLNDGTIGMQMTDSQTYLSQALEYDGERFSDAYPVLARVAWMNGDLDAAIAAADKAIGYYPTSLSSWSQRGRIQFDRYMGLREDESQAKAAKGMLEDAIACHEKALELAGDKADDGKASLRARTLQQLGNCHAWAGDMGPAAKAYAGAMGWDPSVLDFGQLWTTLGGNFVATLDDGEKQFVKRWGERTQSDATLLWYLGYARYMANMDKEFNEAAYSEFEKAETELLAAVKKWPAYTNSLWYVGLARYGRGDFVGAAESIVDFWNRDANGTVALIAADADRAVPRVEYIIGQCVGEGRLLEAATLSEVLAEAVPPGGLNWSYKALFLRDYADNLVRRNAKKADDPEVLAFYEESVSAYERALELEPGNPNFMNDLAVVLHYNLHREYDRCLELYDAAHARAQEMMDDPDVDEQRKVDFISIALRDSTNNAGVLRKQLAKEKKKREEAERKKKEEAGN